MALNEAGINAILNDGNEAVIWLGIGDGPTSADQTSAARVQLASSVAAGQITATGVPYAFTGVPGAGATNALLFSAASAGTFYGSGELTGDQTFNADGSYSLESFAIVGTATSGTPEPAGNRAAPNTVGYLGQLADLVTIAQDADLTGTPFFGNSDWFTGVLVCGADTDLTITGYHFDDVALFFSGDGNHTIEDCLIEAPNGQAYGLGSALTAAHVIVRDTTVRYAGQGSAIGMTQHALFERCDISGGENGAVFYSAVAADFASAPRYSQCWIHDPLFDDLGDHSDMIEVHQDPSLATKLVIEHCYITGGRGPGGVPISAGITMGQTGSAGLLTAKIDNNYIGDGTYHLRVEGNTTGVVVTNNNFGTVQSGEVGFAAVTSGPSIASWTNNRDGSGAAGTGTVVDQP